jgi:hypothetical protein
MDAPPPGASREAEALSRIDRARERDIEAGRGDGERSP